MKTDKTINLKKILKKTKDAHVNREFLASLRKDLVIHMKMNPGTEIPEAKLAYFPFHLVLKPVFLLPLFFALTASGAVVVSQKSLPGDTLYPVKILSERASVAASLSPEARVKAQLLNAETRVKEFSALIEKNSALPAENKERFRETAEKVIENFNAQVSNSLEETNNLKENNDLERALKIENEIHSATRSYNDILSDAKEKGEDEIEEINQFIDSNNHWNKTTEPKEDNSNEGKDEDSNRGRNESNKDIEDQNNQSNEGKNTDGDTGGKSGKDSSGNDNRGNEGSEGRDGGGKN